MQAREIRLACNSVFIQVFHCLISVNPFFYANSIDKPGVRIVRRSIRRYYSIYFSEFFIVSFCDSLPFLYHPRQPFHLNCANCSAHLVHSEIIADSYMVQPFFNLPSALIPVTSGQLCHFLAVCYYNSTLSCCHLFVWIECKHCAFSKRADFFALVSCAD